jgi:hypothetical protein
MLLHRRVAQAMIAEHGDELDEHLGAIAHHFVASARSPDREAAGWSSRAGRRAAELMAWELAAGHFDDAARFLPTGDRGAARERFEVLVGLGRARRASGSASSASSAKAAFFEAMDLAEAEHDGTRGAEAALAWAEVPVDVRRELAEVIAVLLSALDRLDDDDSGLRARLLGRAAFSMAWAADPEARATADAAVAMARRLGDERALAETIVWSGPSRVTLELGRGTFVLDELSTVATRLDDPVLRLQAAGLRFVAAVQRADRPGALEALAEQRRLADGLRLPDLSCRVDKAEADWWLIEDRSADVERRLDDMFELAARTDLRNLALFAGSLLYDLRRRQGRLGELAPWFDGVAARGERLALVPAMRIEVLVAAGRLAEVDAALDSYVADGFAGVWPVELAHSLATLAGCAVAVGHLAAAEGIYERLAPWAGLVIYDQDGGVRGAVDHHLGVLARLLGRRAVAAEHLAAGRRLHDALGSPVLLELSDRAS